MDNTNWWKLLPACLNGARVAFAHEMAWHAGRSVKLHTDPFYQLDYICSGTGTVIICGKSYNMKSGDLFIANPADEHRFFADNTHPITNITLKFYLDGCNELPRFPNYIGNLSSLQFKQHMELQNYIRKTCVEANNTSDESPYLASTMLSTFFLLLIRYLNDAKQSIESRSSNVVMEYIHENYESQITLSDLARVVGLHPQHLCHKFSSDMGISPIAALAQERIKAARRLLADTRLPVSEIAIRVGYPDAYHFSKRFKDIVGVSPRQFRLDRVRFGRK